MKKQHDNMVKLAPIKRKMTNAEKYIDDIAQMVVDGNCPPSAQGDFTCDCDRCPLKDIECMEKKEVELWLMQEADQQ